GRGLHRPRAAGGGALEPTWEVAAAGRAPIPAGAADAAGGRRQAAPVGPARADRPRQEAPRRPAPLVSRRPRHRPRSPGQGAGVSGDAARARALRRRRNRRLPRVVQGAERALLPATRLRGHRGGSSARGSAPLADVARAAALRASPAAAAAPAAASERPPVAASLLRTVPAGADGAGH